MHRRWVLRGFLIGAAFVVATAIALLAADLYRASRGIQAGPVRSTGTVSIGGPFALVDGTGAPVSEADFAGRYMLIYFGYTYCPDVCPTELQRMTEALAALGPDAEPVVPIFITIDPERDTPDAVGDYVTHFHPRMVGLSGTAEAVADAARAYRVYYRKVEDEAFADYLMDHSTLVYLMGPDGRYLQHFSPQTPFERMVEGIRGHVKGAS